MTSKYPGHRHRAHRVCRLSCLVPAVIWVIMLFLCISKFSSSVPKHVDGGSLLLTELRLLEQRHAPRPLGQTSSSGLVSHVEDVLTLGIQRRHGQPQPRIEPGPKQVDEQPGKGEAQQQWLSQHQHHHVPLVSDVPGQIGPPYILPKLIHQAVQDKHSMPCEVQDSIQTWVDMNPGYRHILYDNMEQRTFVAEHYPQLLQLYNRLPFDVERADFWRYLVLHKLGGVYADSDVKCMQPISSWNEGHGFDAALMVGIAKRNMITGDTKEFNQFVIGAMPGHPVLAMMPRIISRNLNYTHIKGLPVNGVSKRVDEGVLMRTGPKAFTSAIKAYAHSIHATWPINSTKADLQDGVLFGSVRAMPKFVLGMGWDTLDLNMTCEDVKKQVRPEALICHQFFASWKTKPEKQLRSRVLTYKDCKKKGIAAL